MLTRDKVLETLRNVSEVPHSGTGSKRRTIYEAGDLRGRGSGRFFMDFAAFSGGTGEEVPLNVIQELENERIIMRAYLDKPEIKAWVLRANREAEEELP
jgi:hypothetical protein